jgi:hypothetical protein
MTVVLFKRLPPVVSISYMTAPLASSMRVVFKGEFIMKMRFTAITARVANRWHVKY